MRSPLEVPVVRSKPRYGLIRPLAPPKQYRRLEAILAYPIRKLKL